MSIVKCEICNIKKLSGHDHTPFHIARVNFSGGLRVNACNICKVSYKTSQGLSGHMKSNHHKDNIYNQTTQLNTLLELPRYVESDEEEIEVTNQIIPIENFHEVNKSYHITHQTSTGPLWSYIKNNKDFILKILNKPPINPIKFKLVVNMKMKIIDKYISFKISNDYYTMYTALEDIPNQIYKSLQEEYERTTSSGESASRFICFSAINLSVANIKEIQGSSYIDLPFINTALVNVKNRDMECFKWAILSALHPVNDHCDRVSKYRPYENTLDFTGIEFPVSLDKITKFEDLNSIAINIFGMEEKEDKSSIQEDHLWRKFPIRLSTFEDARVSIDLLLVNNKNNTHYIWIKDFKRFIGSQLRSHASHSRGEQEKICKRCFSLHTISGYKKHVNLCGTNSPSLIKMPTSGKVIQFKNYSKKIRVPFVIYADCEAINTSSNKTRGEGTRVLSTQHMSSFCLYLKSDYEEIFPSKIIQLYRGQDANDKFVECINNLDKEFSNIFSKIVPIQMTEIDMQDFNQTMICWLCEKELGEDRVRDHDHLNGKYRGAAHNRCNLQAKLDKTVPIFFHNFSNYDLHLFIKELSKNTHHKLKIIAKNSEEYITLSYGCLKFVDSYRIVQSSLDGCTKSMVTSDFKILAKHFPNDVDLLKEKGIFPYDYMDNYEKYNEKEFPDYSKFYSVLNNKNILESEYERGKNIYNSFCKTLGEYNDLYLKTDVLLLADVFETFRAKFDLDPAHYLTAPSLTWDRLLYESKQKLELLIDYDMLMLIEKGLRGGVSSVMGSRYFKANNKTIDGYNPLEPDSWIHYVDANNLYGWAMQQPLPTGGFKWIYNSIGENIPIDDINKIKEILKNIKKHKDDDPLGLLLEVDFEYPDSIKAKTQFFPLAPEHMVIGENLLSDYNKSFRSVQTKAKKLVCTQLPKKNYLVHYRNLKFYLRMGLQVSKIHSIIEFEQSPWMKGYIDGNSEKRALGTSDFEKSIYKLLNNSAFGKTMEDVRKRRNILLLTNPEEAIKIQSRPTFKSSTIFSPTLMAVETIRYEIEMNKPIYVGFSILELSKLKMYEMYYDVLQIKYPSIELLYMDTDSFFLKVPTKDLYYDIENDPILKSKYNNIVGNFKDEAEELIKKKYKDKYKEHVELMTITDCAFSSAKCYYYNLKNENGTKNTSTKCKGVSKNVVEKELKDEHIKNAIMYKEDLNLTNISLRSYKHTMEVIKTDKRAVKGNDDKRFILSNGIYTLPYGNDIIEYINKLKTLNMKYNTTITDLDIYQVKIRWHY